MTGTTRVLPPLPRIGDAVDVADRRRVAIDRQRLGNAQAGAIEQSQRGGVAGDDPGLARFAGARRRIDQLARVGDGERLGQRMRPLGRANGGEDIRFGEVALLEEAQQRAHGGQRPQHRAVLERPARDAAP